MYRVSVRAPRWLRWGSLGVATVVLFLAVSIHDADARKRKRGYKNHATAAKVHKPTLTKKQEARRKRKAKAAKLAKAAKTAKAAKVKKTAKPITQDARYAAIVVDGNTGDELHHAKADSLRHPASLTKIMTLYMLFEQLDAGKFKLNTPLDVSAHAASQSPTKLGLRAGQTIEVEDAIKALVTRSANDAAVVIGEAIGGSEGEFAKLMTRKARALGMSRTVYKNASGLPDAEQVTTARDQALLGLKIQERFPKYYRYFGTQAFQYRGNSIHNHNRLLGRVEGVDGIKTGYTRASGFNLVSSVRRSGRYIVAVVLGGASGSARDARMRVLIEGHIKEASLKRTGTAIAAAPEPAESRSTARLVTASAPTPKTAAEQHAPARYAPATATPSAPAPKAEAVSPVPPPQLYKLAAAPPRADDPVRSPTVHGSLAPEPGSTDPIKPVLVKTVTVRMAAVKTASLTPTYPTYQPPAPPPVAPQAKEEPLPPAPVARPVARPDVLSALPVRAIEVAAAAEVTPRASEAAPRASARGDWVIQIGAFPEEGKARQQLSSAQKISRLVGTAEAYTEPVVRGDKTLYRARFAGFDKDQAEAACKQLKRSEITCIPTRN
jgi:D-alanyl-D-alanine carboxypeptidase